MRTKLIASLITACGLGLLTECGPSGEQSVYLIPNHFVGNILIAYDQPDGAPAEYEQGVRIYRIPATGFLKTRFGLERRWHIPDEYYYVDARGFRLKSLPYFSTAHKAATALLPSDPLCYLSEPVSSSRSSTRYLVFAVSSRSQADSVLEARGDLFRNSP